MIQKLFLLLILGMTLLHAEQKELLDEYRQNGITPIEHRLDVELTRPEYWMEQMKDQNTTFGYIERYNSILICDKNESSLKLYQKDANQSYVLKNEYHAFTGKNPGDKQNEGDLKTPVGIYNLVKKLDNVDSFYGPMAFVTSYPNLYDRYLNKNGHGIWIHGLPLHQERDEFTKGCIAIDNEGLVCLNKEIDLSKTLLLIYENQEIEPVTKEQLAKIAAWLYKWRYAWKYNDIESYLANYAADFKRFDGKDLQSFAAYKRAVFARNEEKSIIFTNLNIIPYPNHPGIYQITFFERYKSPHYTFNGNKELLVRLQDDKIEIFSEK